MVNAQAVVAGAGFGGLAAALRLRARGLAVTVLDARAEPGGRSGTVRAPGFTYDAGPTVLTAPVLFEELFALFGERLQDHVELLPVTPWYQMRFADGSRLNYGGSTHEIQAAIAAFSQEDAAQYPAFLDWSRQMFERGYEELGDQSFDGAVSMLKALPSMVRLRADRSVYAATSQFFKDERVRRAFSIQPLLVGGNPMDTTSIYSLIHYLERKWGVWFVRGGMHALVQALVALGQRHGVHYGFGQPVQQLLRGPAGGVVGVRTPHQEHAASIVVSNADPMTAHAWMPGYRAPKPMWGQPEYSMGLFVWYFSTRGQYQDLPHHTILFGQTYHDVLADVFDRKCLPTDLSIYLHRPAATDPSCAPEGLDSFYALVPVPNLSGGLQWDEHKEAFRSLLQRELEQRALPGLSGRLVDSHVITPTYFAQELNAPYGAAFSLKPTLMQSAGFRWPNRSPDVPGLYFVGAGTHPGAGVPGVVTSAKVVERAIFGSVASSLGKAAREQHVH